MKLCNDYPNKCYECENCIRNERNRIKQNERNRIMREFYNKNKKNEEESLDRLFKAFKNEKV